jgi:hypothetical protein
MSVWSDGAQGKLNLAILPPPAAIDQLVIMFREDGRRAGVVRCTFYVSASLPDFLALTKNRKKKRTKHSRGRGNKLPSLDLQ